MKRMMIVAIGALPIVAFSFSPKPAAAEVGLRRPLLSPTTVVADRPDDNDRRNNDRRDTDDRSRNWRDRHSDRRDDRFRYDDRQRSNSNGRYDSGRYDNGRYDNGRYDNGRYDNRRDNQRRIWIPSHWESGFLGIGRKWVAGHYETR